MSQLTHTQPRVLRLRRPQWVALAAVVLFAGAAIALWVALSGEDEATETPATAVSGTAPGVRYDGGLEEGSRGLVRRDSAAGIRYDGGLEEGSHGMRPASAVSAPPAGVLYDRGPAEGSHGIRPASAAPASPAGVRYDGGPEEGSRGLGR